MEEVWTALPGRVCESKAGRDKKSRFIIIAVADKDFVLLADGKYRTLAKPKRKRLKHLAMRREFIEGLAEKFSNKSRVFDSEIKSALNKIEAAEKTETDGRAAEIKEQQEPAKPKKAAKAKGQGETKEGQEKKKGNKKGSICQEKTISKRKAK